MGEYFNLKLKEMNLQITRYTTMYIKVGIGEYPDEIAEKFSCILEKVQKQEIIERVISETIIETIEELDEEVDESIVDITIEENIDEVVENYEEMSYWNLKKLVDEKKIDIEGKKTKKKLIEALTK